MTHSSPLPYTRAHLTPPACLHACFAACLPSPPLGLSLQVDHFSRYQVPLDSEDEEEGGVDAGMAGGPSGSGESSTLLD